MFTNTSELKLLGELISCEGKILAIYRNDNYYFANSKIENENKTIFFRLNETSLLEYLKSEITLRELFLRSEDILIPEKDKLLIQYHLKEDFLENIQYGNKYIKEIEVDLINKKFLELLMTML